MGSFKLRQVAAVDEKTSAVEVDMHSSSAGGGAAAAHGAAALDSVCHELRKQAIPLP